MIKKIEEIVKKEALNYIAEHVNLGVFFSDEKRKCLYVNSEWEKISGLTAEESYGYGWLKVIHPDDREMVKRKTIDATNENKLLDVTFRFITPSNEIKYIHLKSIQVTYSEKETGYVGIVLETNFAKTAEKELSQHKRDFSSVINSIDDIIVEVSAQYIIVNIWSGLFKTAQKLRKSLIGQPLQELQISLQLEDIKQIIDDVIQTKKPQLYEFRSNDNEQEKWYSAKLTYLQDNNSQEEPHVLCVLRDITDEKTALLAYRESEEKFTSAFEYAAVGMSIVNIKGEFLQVNKALCKITGYSPEELLKLDFQTLTHADDIDIDLEFVRQMLAGERETYEMEKRYIHKNGHEVWILLSVSLVKDEKNEPIYFISQMQDITIRKENERTLKQTIQNAEQANRAKSDFLSVMSHEIRTPLNAIIGITQILKEDNPAEHQVENLNVLDFSAHNLLILINDILDYNKIEAGKVSFEKISFNLKN
ncbi:MAG: PAS domain S-box protein, partial [Sphingobacteriales bacterium]